MYIYATTFLRKLSEPRLDYTYSPLNALTKNNNKVAYCLMDEIFGYIVDMLNT